MANNIFSRSRERGLHNGVEHHGQTLAHRHRRFALVVRLLDLGHSLPDELAAELARPHRNDRVRPSVPGDASGGYSRAYGLRPANGSATRFPTCGHATPAAPRPQDDPRRPHSRRFVPGTPPQFRVAAHKREDLFSQLLAALAANEPLDLGVPSGMIRRGGRRRFGGSVARSASSSSSSSSSRSSSSSSSCSSLHRPDRPSPLRSPHPRRRVCASGIVRVGRRNRCSLCQCLKVSGNGRHGVLAVVGDRTRATGSILSSAACRHSAIRRRRSGRRPARWRANDHPRRLPGPSRAPGFGKTAPAKRFGSPPIDPNHPTSGQPSRLPYPTSSLCPVPVGLLHCVIPFAAENGTFSRRAHTSPKRKRGAMLRIPRSRFGLVCNSAACSIAPPPNVRYTVGHTTVIYESVPGPVEIARRCVRLRASVE